MMAERRRFHRVSSGARLLAALLLWAAPLTARADGDGAHSERFRDARPGLGLTTMGIGLGGRRLGGGPHVPITEASLVLSTVPSGASVVVAYLYWVVLGDTGDDTVSFGRVPTALTGTLIGTSAHTCWDDFDDPTDVNRVYRAEVTTRVTGNGTYLIRDFPSSGLGSDSQGASLVVVYDDPADARMGAVHLHDGAISGTGGTVAGTFDAVPATSITLAATFRLGVGDGQGMLTDGTVRFSDTLLIMAAGGHFPGRAGTYWDEFAYDVTSLIDPTETNIPWLRNGGADCLVFAYSALSLYTELLDVDADGIDDGADNCPGLSNPDQADSDRDGATTDGHGDACDNCVDDRNASQVDRDADGAGDVCDNCVDDPNRDQANDDTDSWGNVCDNCPNHANESQVDSDANGVGDACEGIAMMDAGMRDGGVVPLADAGDGGAPGRDAGSDGGARADGGPVGAGGGCGCRARSSSPPRGVWILGVLALASWCRRPRR